MKKMFLITSALAALPLAAQAAQQPIAKTVTLSRLEIKADALPKAAAGQDLTLTVDGVGVPIAAGVYTGKVVLTPTAADSVPYRSYGPYSFRSAVHVDTTYRPDRSVAAIVQGGSVGAGRAENITIVSHEPLFNGIVVKGNADYVVDGVKIDLLGNGGNDFVGFGAAIMATDNARLTVNKADIHTKGAIRTALFIGGKSNVTMNDCNILTENGTLPAGYKFSIAPGEMMEVPYGMGLTGNVRSTNLIDNGTVTYNRCHVVTQGWGALSSDGDGPTHMFVKDSHIETIESGYGAYANGEAHDLFDNTRFDVTDYGVIVGGPGSATFTNHSVVNSKRVGVMAHQGTGGGTIQVDGGSVFNTASTAIIIKGRGSTIVIDNATINPGNGVILQTMENDDPIMVAMAAGGPGGPGGPGGEAPGAGGPPAPAAGPEGPGDLPGARAPAMSPDVVVTLRNAELKGDLYHAMKNGAMNVTIANARLDGVISHSVTTPVSGKAPTKETFREVGYVTNKVVPVEAKQGVSLRLETGATWTVRGQSFLSALEIAEGAKLQAASGKLVLKVDGKVQPVKPGRYAGQIELTLN